MGEFFGFTAFGGAERQMSMLAEGLARSGCTLCAVSRRVDDVDVTAAWPHGPTTLYEGPVGVRYRWIPAIVRAIARTESDVLYQRGISVLTIAAARASKRSGSGFVWAASSDGDADSVWLRFRRAIRFRKASGRSLLSPKTWLGALGDAWIHARGVAAARHADVIVAQSAWQVGALSRRMRLSRERFAIIPSLVPTPRSPAMGERRTVLWVGGEKPIKRPALFATLAKEGPPEFEYAMAGKGLDAGERSRYPGVRLLGALCHEEVIELMSRAIVLVNTSEAEGFPNTFLEAWASGTPVLTLGVDPDGVITADGLGWVCHDIEEAAGVLRALVDDSRVAEEFSNRCVKYVRSHFDNDATVRATKNAVLRAAAAAAGSAGKANELSGDVQG